MKLSRRAGRFLLDGHHAEASLADLMKWQLGGKRARWPQRVENGDQPPPPLRNSGNALHATWIGQSTVLIQTAGVNILTDPFLTDRASPLPFLGPRRVRAPGLLPQDMPPVDIVLLSHNHYDHMDLAGLSQLVRHHRPKFITPAGNARYLRPTLTGLEIVEREWGGGD